MRKKWLFIAGAFVVLFAIFYAALPKHTIAPTQTANQTTTQTSPAPDPTTADWKTYTNTKFSYSFKYPANSKVSNNFYMDCEINECTYLKIVIPGDNKELLVQAINYPPYLENYREKLKEIKDKGKIVSESGASTSTLGEFLNLPAIISDTQFQGTQRSIEFINDDTAYDLYYDINSPVKRSIVSTFKFTK